MDTSNPVSLAATASTEATETKPIKVKKTKTPKVSKKPAAKKPAAKKPKASKKPAAKKTKAPKAKKPSIVSRIGDFLLSNKGEEFKATALAKQFKCRGVEVHRAIARLERKGATVEATRSGPTGKPGRRSFLYRLTKGVSK